jgi:hypothetical protein
VKQRETENKYSVLSFPLPTISWGFLLAKPIEIQKPEETLDVVCEVIGREQGRGWWRLALEDKWKTTCQKTISEIVQSRTYHPSHVL